MQHFSNLTCKAFRNACKQHLYDILQLYLSASLICNSAQAIQYDRSICATLIDQCERASGRWTIFSRFSPMFGVARVSQPSSESFFFFLLKIVLSFYDTNLVFMCCTMKNFPQQDVLILPAEMNTWTSFRNLLSNKHTFKPQQWIVLYEVGPTALSTA